MKKGLSVFALAALLFGVGAVADSNHEVQAKSHSKGGSVKRAKATPVRRAAARPVARRAAARPVARRAVARPVARRVVAKPVARRVVAKPVARKATTRTVVRKTTPTTRKNATRSVVRKTTPTAKTAVARKATTAKKGTKTAVVRKVTTAKKGTKAAVARKATAAKKGTKAAVVRKATAAKKGTKAAATRKATTAKKGTKTATVAKIGISNPLARKQAEIAAKAVGATVKTVVNVKNHFTNEKGKFRLPLHGNYCGPGHGNLTKNPKPVDTLDGICRKHDIGYKKDGYFSRKANDKFISGVINNFDKMKTTEKVKAATFAAGFAVMNYTPLREVSRYIGGNK